MAKEMFRKEAMQELGSPEELDKMLRVITPKGWIALSALGVLLIGIIL